MNELVIYGDIGESLWGESITDASVKSALDAKPPGDVTVRINSPGGSVFDGFAIYQLLKQRDGIVTVYVDGLAASAASVIAMAGDEIVMGNTSLMMIHDPWTMSIGDSSDMRQTADLLDKIKGSIIEAYKDVTSLDAEELSTMMAAETWMSASEAVDMGFATAISGSSTSEPKNVARPWINKAVPEQPTESEQDAWRLAHAKRKLALLNL